MEELRTKIKSVMHEIEFTHLKKNWVDRLIEAGIDTKDAHKWVAEIGHVVDEYERSLRRLTKLFEANSVEEIAVELDTWVTLTQDMTVWTIGEAMKRLEGHYDKYLPLDEKDEE